MEETERAFLTNEELKRLMDMRFKKPKYELVRDLFVFCCFTGLSYCELYNLSDDNIRTYFDDHEWIHISRQKTTVLSEVQLLDIPKMIYEKYKGMGEGRQGIPRTQIPRDSGNHQKDNEAVRHREGGYVAYRTAHNGHDGLPVE